MPGKKFYPYLFFLAAFTCSISAFAQIVEPKANDIDSGALSTNHSDTSLVTVKEITITGNKKTRRNTILREIPFQENEQYPLSVLVEKFTVAKKNLLNTAMFQQVVVALKSTEDYNAIVEITVIERWYVFPLPYMRIVDRSFNEWAKNQNMALNRINYGITLTYKNITGRNDKLNINLINGYTKKITALYEGLFLDKGLKWSSNLSAGFGKNKEINYTTVNDKQLFYKDTSRFIHSFFNMAIEFAYRPAIKTKHTFGFGYNYETFADTILRLNSSYSFQKNKISYPQISYRMQYFNVDFIPYPTKGYAAEVVLQKRGFNKQINLWQFIAKTSATWPLSEKNFFNLRLTAMLKLPFHQPYFTQRFIGYNDIYLQGYEDYVIDGVAGGFSKATLSRKIFHTAIKIRSDRIKKLNNIPIKLYAKAYGNTGYVYNSDFSKNTFANQLLYSGGVGLDLIIFYDLIFKFEWSFNHLGQNGLYLHDKKYL